MIALLLGLAQAAECPEASDPAAVIAEAQRAREAFVQADRGTFEAASGAVTAAAPCLPLGDPALAAQVHSTTALVDFLARDESGSIGAFQAALAADPDTEVESWLPEMHPLHLQYQLGRRLEPGPTLSLEPAKGDRIWVDGARDRLLVNTQPAVLQLEREGQLSAGQLWRPGEPLPTWAPEARARLPREARRRLVLGGATVAMAGAAGALGLVSYSADSRFNDRETPCGQLEDLKTRANVSAVAAYGSLGAAAALGTTLVITW